MAEEMRAMSREGRAPRLVEPEEMVRPLLYVVYLHKYSAKVPSMPLNIKDPATEKSVRELAALTGETVTTAVHRAAEERLQRVRQGQPGRSLAAEILEIGRRCASLPDLDARTADEILGYEEHGLPR
jgi:antitoxin VapB